MWCISHLKPVSLAARHQNSMDPRLKSLANASKVLLASDDLNPPQIFAGQAALLEVLVSCGQVSHRF